MQPYTGEVIPLAQSATPELKPYTGEIIPLETEPTRDERGVPTGLRETVYNKPTPAPVTPEANNEGFSDALRTGIGLVGGTTPAMQEQMEAVGHKPISGYVADAVGGVVYNAPRNTAETVLAVGDELSGSNRAESFNQVVPKYESDSAAGEIITTGGEMLAGGGGVYMLAKESLKKAPKFINWLAGLGAEATGAGVAASSDSDTLLIGKEGFLGSVGQDAVDNPILQKKIDLAADALVTAAPVAGLAEYGAKGLAIAKDLTFDRFVNYFSRTAKDDQIARSILSELGGITPDMPDEEVIRIFDKVIATINDPANKNLKDALQARITPEEFARLTPEQQKILDINRDTVSAFEAGNAPGSAEVAGARSLREGVVRQGAPDVQEAMARPVRAADDYNEMLNAEAGGRGAANEAAKVVQQSGKEQVQAAQDVAADTAKAFEAEKADLSKVIADDPIGKQMENLGTDVNINTTAAKDQARTDIGTNLEKSYEESTKGLNDRAKNVPDDVEVDRDAIAELADEIAESNLLSKNDKAILLNDETGFKELFAMTPTLTKRINELAQRGESHLAEPLIRLRDTINNPVGGDPAVAEFRDYYAKEWAPKWKDGVGQDYAGVYQGTTRINRETGAKTVLSPVNKEIGTDAVIDKSLQKTPYTKQLTTLLGKDGGEQIGTLVVSDALSNVQKIINRKGSVGPEDFNDVLGALEQHGAAFSAVAPDQAKRLNDLATRVRDRNIELSEVQKEIDEIMKGAANVEKEVLGKELAPFFKQDSHGGVFNEVSNGYDAFNQVLKDTAQATDKEGKTKLQRIIGRVKASGNELANKGLQAAWTNAFRDKFFSVADDATGTVKVKSKFIADEKIGKNELLEAGREIFKDQPGVMTTVEALAREADRISKARSSTSHLPNEPKTIAQKGKSAFEMVTTFLFGPLSRTGSKVRSAGSKLLEKSNPEEYLNKTLQAVLADPDEFNRIVKPFMERQKKKVPVEDMKALLRWAVNTGVKSPEEAEMDAMQADFVKEDDTEEALGQ